MTPEERALRARLAAHTSWAATSDRAARTASARRAFRDRFADMVDPNHELPESERQERAESARRAFYVSMAYRSAQARRRRAS